MDNGLPAASPLPLSGNLKLLCSECNEEIIIDSIDTNSLDFKLKFHCLKNHKGEKSLLETINISKKLSNGNSQSLCQAHKDPIKYFCHQCKENCCSKCIEEGKHKDHVNETKQLSNLYPKKNSQIELIEKKLEKIQKYKKQFEEWINQLKINVTNYFDTYKAILDYQKEAVKLFDSVSSSIIYHLFTELWLFLNKTKITKEFEYKDNLNHLSDFYSFGHQILDFAGFFVNPKPGKLCNSCFDNLGKPNGYDLYNNHCTYSSGKCGRTMASQLYCSVCDVLYGWCNCCGGIRGGTIYWKKKITKYYYFCVYLKIE